jgi:hypothetical protein
MGRALSAYSKPIIATAAAVAKYRIFMQIQFSDHTPSGLWAETEFEGSPGVPR